ncbi:MAG: tRNA dihydrouridine(16) synthase DusC [Betaproteobacteria bacterium]|nr:MAG: tRNA dihydrouridine(16) synthase DusC [Betaproteobacteria bacterium]
MEGLLDWVLRDILTRVADPARSGESVRSGGVDRCVSEFIRVSGTLLPNRAFIRVMPELLNAGRTLSGVPVAAQLLGSDPNCLAENAARVAALKPAGIDLNFGCPAKIVNRHGGGAMLLEDPALIAKIISAVRRAVPAEMPVTAKMRLGFNDDSRAEECAQAMADSGASEIVVHGRTKAHGYRPPAYWERIADVRAAVNVPVVANGEIWTVADALRCREISGCNDIMLGRGIVANPGLGWAVRAATHSSSACRVASLPSAQVAWPDLLPLIAEFWKLVSARVIRKHRAGRLKQWLNMLRRRFPEAELAYAALRTINDSDAIDAWLRRELASSVVNTLSLAAA